MGKHFYLNMYGIRLKIIRQRTIKILLVVMETMFFESHYTDHQPLRSDFHTLQYVSVFRPQNKWGLVDARMGSSFGTVGVNRGFQFYYLRPKKNPPVPTVHVWQHITNVIRFLWSVSLRKWRFTSIVTHHTELTP